MYKKARQGKIQRQSFQQDRSAKANLARPTVSRMKAQPAPLMLVLQRSLDNGIASQKAGL